MSPRNRPTDDPEGAPHRAPEPAPGPAPERAREPDPDPGTPRGTRPGIAPDTAPDTGPTARSDSAPGTAPIAGPGTAPDTAPNAGPGTAPIAGPGTAPIVEQLVGWLDDTTGAVQLTGWAPGPAGLATVVLGGGGLELSVDYAEPGAVSQIVVEIGALQLDAVVGALNSLFGGRWASVRSSLTAEPKIAWTGGYPVVGPRGRGVLSRLGRLAILQAETNERRHSPAGAAMAAIEQATIAADLPAAYGLALRPSELLSTAGAELLDVGTPELSLALDWRGRLELAALLARALATIDLPDQPALHRRLHDLQTELGGSAPDAPMAAASVAPQSAVPPAGTPSPAAPPPPGAMAAPAMTKAAEAARAPTPDRAREQIAVPPVAIDPALDVELMHSSVNDAHLDVVARTAGERALWVRLFRTDRRPVLLAMGPLERNEFGSASGTVLIPQALAPGELVADITDRPEQRWLAPTMRTTRRAVRKGRDACRDERTGDLVSAAESWRQSADDWHTIGDDRREALARRYADGEAPSIPQSPRRDAGGGGRDRRQPVAPFVLDRVAR